MHEHFYNWSCTFYLLPYEWINLIYKNIKFINYLKFQIHIVRNFSHLKYNKQKQARIILKQNTWTSRIINF